MEEKRERDETEQRLDYGFANRRKGSDIVRDERRRRRRKVPPPEKEDGASEAG